MDKCGVGICCTEQAYPLFKRAWESTCLEPDREWHAGDGYCYFLWNNILWDKVLNKKTSPIFDVMDYLDLLQDYPCNHTHQEYEMRWSKISDFAQDLHTLAETYYLNDIVCYQDDEARLSYDVPEEEYMEHYMTSTKYDFVYQCLYNLDNRNLYRGSDMGYYYPSDFPIPD